MGVRQRPHLLRLRIWRDLWAPRHYRQQMPRQSGAVQSGAWAVSSGALLFGAAGLLNQIVEPDREATYANAGRMPDRVGNGTRRAGDSDLAHPLDAERVHVWIMLLDNQGLQHGGVGVHRDVVFRARPERGSM